MIMSYLIFFFKMRREKKKRKRRKNHVKNMCCTYSLNLVCVCVKSLDLLCCTGVYFRIQSMNLVFHIPHSA